MTGQLLHDPIRTIELTYKGSVTQLNTNPVTAAALAGLLKTTMPDVNMVSAPVLAKELTTEERKFVVVGTIYRGEPRIVRLFGVPMDAAFSANMIYVRNEDKPGFIGKLGAILGDNKVNIATFSLGRMDQGEEAVCLVSVDGQVSDGVAEHIRGLDHVKIVDVVSL